ELVHHRVQRLFELENFAADVDGDLARKVTVCDGGRDFRDISDLTCEVGSHEIDVLRQVLPCATHTKHLRLATELAFCTNLPGDAGNFARECVELVHHGVDGVLELENLALDVDGNLAGQVTAGNCRRYLGDISDLGRQV